MNKEIEILYHGTKFKKTANKILKEGFLKDSYFAYDLNDAMSMGGKYVFEVLFLKEDLPKYWQVRCANKIEPDRITRMTLYKHEEQFLNKEKMKQLESNSTYFFKRKPYYFDCNWNKQRG